MIASLPMYDRPETRAANDRFWSLIRAGLPADLDAPETLTRSANIWNDWENPGLLLSQTCSLPYRARLHGKVTIVATPVQSIDCTPGHYFSQMVIRRSDKRSKVKDFDGARLAINDDLSQSGWGAAVTMAETHGISFGEVVTTGAHRNSAHAIAENHADIAAIDAVTWTLLTRHDEIVNDLKVIASTPSTPALPFITAHHGHAETLYAAIENAMTELSADDKNTLCLNGLTRLPESAYLDQPIPALI